MIISVRRYASHDWSNSYVGVMVGPRLDMSEFTEGVWQTVNSRREAQLESLLPEQTNTCSLREFLQGQNVFVNL